MTGGHTCFVIKNEDEMTDIQYYVIDTETTGTKDHFHEVTQISIIRCTDRHQLNRYIKAEFPKRTSADALKYTGRTMSDLYKGDPRKEVVEFCNKFFEEDGVDPEFRCIVGHNIYSFDKRFLYAMWEAEGLVFPANLWLDTIPYVKEYVKREGIAEKKFNLNKACEIVGVTPRAGVHNAVIDTQNNYKLFKALTDTHKVATISSKTGKSLIKPDRHVLHE